MELTLAQRKAVTRAQLARWRKASKSEKTAILDAVVAVTGWHRDHARKAIRRQLADQDASLRAVPIKVERPVRPSRVVYDAAAVELLTMCWAALDGPSGKRLHPALPAVIENLARHGRLSQFDDATIAAVQAMSSATIDRRLGPARCGLVARKGISHTRPGSMLKSSITMRTWAQWDDTVPGFLQIDLVGHEGGDANGAFFYTLNATDVATGWTESVTVRSKGERIVAAGLNELVLRFPFHIAGVHSDNGSEFINYHLAKWCEALKITFTRGRAANKNDQAHVEQKNWTVVRRTAGYFRYDTPRELELLNELWALTSLQVNLFLPQQKLVSKQRQGAKVTKRHDTAATPLDRLLNSHAGYLDNVDAIRLGELRAATDLIELRHQIADLQANLIALARHRGAIEKRTKTNAAYLSRRKLNTPHTQTPTNKSTTQTKRAS